jgi:DNA-binding protein H-NS
MTNYSDLLAQKAQLERQASELEKQLAAARKEERSGVIAQIRNLMAEHGLTAADLEGRAPRAAKENANKGKPVAPKFRDPATGDTWSGRGLKPKWLTTALESGKKVEDFAL